MFRNKCYLVLLFAAAFVKSVALSSCSKAGDEREQVATLLVIVCKKEYKRYISCKESTYS